MVSSYKHFDVAISLYATKLSLRRMHQMKREILNLVQVVLSSSQPSRMSRFMARELQWTGYWLERFNTLRFSRIWCASINMVQSTLALVDGRPGKVGTFTVGTIFFSLQQPNRSVNNPKTLLAKTKLTWELSLQVSWNGMSWAKILDGPMSWASSPIYKPSASICFFYVILFSRERYCESYMFAILTSEF